MTGVLTLYRSSIGKKVIMAVTGVILVGFLVLHMYGNLKMFQGPVVFNDYAAGLREIGHPIFGHEHLLWLARLILLAAVIGHIWSATVLTIQSRKSAYAQDVRVSGTSRYGQKKRQTGYAAYTMRFGGVVILLFIIYHLLHFTFGLVGYGPGQYIPEQNGEFSVYNNVVLGFQNPLVSGFYILAMIFLGLHLFHGIWSAFQTLGLNNAKYTSLWRGLAILLTLIIVVPNISFPIAVMAGIVR